MKFAIIALIASVSAINTARFMPEEAGPTKAAGYEEIPAFHANAAYGDGYSRVVPVQYREMRDDRLMNSMVGKYAREAVVEGRMTGHMFLNEADARAASDEVIANHKGADRAVENEGRFAEVWNHFDVNHDGLVEVERMPQFFRMLLGNALDISLQ